METVVLKNETEEAVALVATVMVVLNRLMEAKPIVVYELVQKCRDRAHQFFGNAKEDLLWLSLVQEDGQVHSSIKNVVLSAVCGDGLEMTIGDPVKR